MLETPKCPNCGAPLPVAAPGQVEVCPYCHAEALDKARVEPRREEPPEPAPRFPHYHPSRATDDAPVDAPIGTALLWWKVFGAIAVVVVGLLFVAVYFLTSGKESKSGATSSTSATASAPARPSVLMLANLRTAQYAESPEWRAIIAPGMIGTYEAFDVVANVDWVSRIATAWNPGAVLVQVNVSRMARDGTVNLAQPFRGGNTQSSVNYYFRAPGVGEIAIGMNDPSAFAIANGGTPHVAIMVHLSATEQFDSVMQPFSKPACTLAQVFKAAAKPLAKIDAALVPAGRNPGITAFMSNDGTATRIALGYVTMNPSTTTVESHSVEVNATTCVLERTR